MGSPFSEKQKEMLWNQTGVIVKPHVMYFDYHNLISNQKAIKEHNLLLDDILIMDSTTLNFNI